jgi:hypothetical protein
MDINLKKIHSECGWHEKAILGSTSCGCFNCLSIFPPSEITEWINETPDCPRGEGKTAICPKCDIDSVLPDSIDSGLSLQLLELMQKEYL